ncbi:enoyl-CoA hydratase-related protein [Terrabacter carboxydivorans]|uniref:Enoyl-CoA hydratase-related protein n=1 Tax=Terrabacter carboxydivorans TaxID=619730 RepID=A0ABP5XU62_9MICO
MLLFENDNVTVTLASGVATVTIDRPPVNALNRELLGALDAAVAAAVRSPDSHSILLTGTGRRFVAGADITMLAQLDGRSAAEFGKIIQGTFNRIEAASKPTVAVINGDALGGGLELALACDIRFAVADARLGLPEIRLGLVPGAGGTQRLTEALGKPRALEMLLTGTPLRASQALDLGLVNGVFDRADLGREAFEWARSLTAGPPLAYAAAKACVRTNLTAGRDRGFLEEVKSLENLVDTADGREGVAAFLQKRAPHFRGC